MTGYSKYELLEATIKATRDKSITLDEIEKQLKNLKVVPDGELNETTKKAVVDHFKLEKQLSRSDRALISALKKENSRLVSENTRLEQLLEEKIETIGKMVQEMYNYEPEPDEEPQTVDTEPSIDNYQAQQMDLTPESQSQQ